MEESPSPDWPVVIPVQEISCSLMDVRKDQHSVDRTIPRKTGLCCVR